MEIIYSHAAIKDKKLIKNFINRHWKKNHVLYKSSAIFDFYFFRQKRKLQFFVAKDSYNNIQAILGYITNKQFDKNISFSGAWLSMWCSKKDAAKVVGIKLLDFLEKNLNINFIASLGVSSKVLPIYERLGYQKGQIIHFIKRIDKFSYNSNKFKKNLIYECILNNKLSNSSYGKSISYLKKKYQKNNFYDYKFFSIKKKSKLINVLVGRVINYKKKKIFRIIDFVGSIEGLSLFAKNYDFCLIDKSIKFVDILCCSPFYNLKINGFYKSNKKSFLPIYYEPLIDRYSEKNFIFKKVKYVNKNFLILTGDCDQDRPNIWGI